MINTIESISYEKRANKKGVILIDIPFYVVTKEGKTFTVNDYVLKEDGSKEIFSAKEVFRTNDELNQLDAYLEANNDFSGLTPQEREWTKIRLGLMIDTQTNLFEDGKTIYDLDPSVWVFTNQNQ